MNLKKTLYTCLFLFTVTHVPLFSMEQQKVDTLKEKYINEILEMAPEKRIPNTLCFRKEGNLLILSGYYKEGNDVVWFDVAKNYK